MTCSIVSNSPWLALESDGRDSDRIIFGMLHNRYILLISQVVESIHVTNILTRVFRGIK